MRRMWVGQRGIRVLLVVSAAALLAGCALELESEGESTVADEWRGNDTEVSDPCQCTTIECMEDYVHRTLGCNVCIALTCEGGIHLESDPAGSDFVGSAHVCVRCGFDFDPILYSVIPL